ncbi:MAG TPA: FMN-binding protein [Thermotogota bacterium]|nr:FMN-binding protein [Thermotogota bacterium]HRW34793.1 FMN-binding protein [Thermotogota bacterium]
MTGWIITGVIVIAVAIAGGIGWSKISKEHQQIRNLPLNKVNFSHLKDGTYKGFYEGGMYKWRENEIQVKVEDGQVTNIQVLQHKENRPKEFTDKLFNQVIESQSLQVDIITGATLTSKAYLQGVENALKNAQK